MTLVGIPLDEQDAIFATVAGVLHLGNVAFQEGPDESSAVTAAAQQHLQAAATLLGVDADGLLKALTTRTRQTVDGTPSKFPHLTFSCQQQICLSILQTE